MQARDDKRIEDATSADAVVRMYRAQGHSAAGDGGAGDDDDL